MSEPFPPSATTEAPASVIHDIGYRRYAGPRLGRGYAVRSLYTHSLRTAFGLGRGLKAKIFPWTVVGLVMMVAVVVTATASQSGERVVTYPEFTDVMGLLALLYLAAVAPELVSRDLRARVLPLYFARPLRRSDYALAKSAALVTATWLLLGAPQLVIFAGAAFDADGPKRFWREVTDLLGGLGYAGVFAFVNAAVAILVASLTGRRAFAAGGIVAVFLVTVPVAGVLSAVGGPTQDRLSGLVSPTLVVQGVGRWWLRNGEMDIGRFGPVYAVAAAALVAGCVALLMLRYRRVDS